jgi:predicted Rossmann fold nucleotide-binding protein DprA/Smf involved in DNA uptake
LTSSGDVLEALGIEPEPKEQVSHPILERLPATIDELVRTTGLDAARVAALLAELELDRAVAEGDGVYRALGR